MKASQYIAKFLHAQGVTTVFELVGGMITHMVDSLHQEGNIRIISMHHEQGAAFAADAMGRMTGIPGVAMATSGPGATNLLTGIGSCHFDSSPAVFITGQVNRSEMKGDLGIRQLGFQETDIVSMARPITKAVFQVLNPQDLPSILEQAFQIATSDRPGPVLIDIPMDIQRMDVQAELPTPKQRRLDLPVLNDNEWSNLFSKLEASQKPLILAGAGVRASRSIEAFRSLVERLNIPVVNSLLGVDVLPHDHPLKFGMIGSYGNRWANLAIGEADLIFVLGSRLDIRQTGADTQAWKGDRTIIHVDCEEAELNHRIKGSLAIHADLHDFLGEANSRFGHLKVRQEWLDSLNELRNSWPDTAEIVDVPGINPNSVIHQITSAFLDASAVVVDVGQHQMWAGQSADMGQDERFLTSGGMGSMGFALPAAIGAAISTPESPVILIAGDGGFQCNIQELQTVARNWLPIKMIILDNGCHGMVRQFQQSYFDERYQSTCWGYSAPDFVAVAEAYGISGRSIESEEEISESIDWLKSDLRSPQLLRVAISAEANAFPKIAFGRPMTEMEPYAVPIDMEGT